MAPIVRRLNQLRSRAIRQRSTGDLGVRSFVRYGEEGGGGLLGTVKGWLQKLGGFLSSGLKKLSDRLRSISFTDMWGAIVGAAEVVLEFNWQVSDAEINAQIDAIYSSVVERGFESVGKSLGYALCGVAPGAVIAKFNPALGAHVLSEVGPEIADELASEWSSALSSSSYSIASAELLRYYKNLRAGLKGNPDFFLSQILRGIMGDDNFQKWGNPGQDEWTFSKGAGDKFKAVVTDEWWREKWQAAWEGFSEGCIDAGFLVAGALDDWYGRQSYVREDLLGRERIVEVLPNRSVPEESYIVSGNEQALRPVISQIINQSRALDNRDLGTELVSADYEPIITNNGIEITLEFFNYPSPPFWTKERRKNLARSRLTVPNCNRSKITWDHLKQTFGPNIAFQRGDIRMQANLKNGRQLVAWVSTKNEGKTLAKKLVELTDTEIIYPLEFKERDEYPDNGRYKPKKKEPQYLAFCHIINIPRITKYEEKRTPANQQEINDKITDSKYKAIMHFDKKPSWIDGQIAEVLKPSN